MRRIVVIAALVIPTTASAHFKLVTPESKYTQTSLGDPQKEAPCGPTGDGGTATNKVTTVMSGSMLTVTLSETIYHPGHYRVSIAQDEGGLPPEPPVTTGTSQCGSAPIDPNPALPVLADGVLKHTSQFSGQQTAQIPLPPGMTCNNCVVQVLEFMSSHPAPCFYHHCAIVNVTTTGMAADAGIDGPGDSGGGCSTGNGVGPGAALLLLALLRRRRR